MSSPLFCVFEGTLQLIVARCFLYVIIKLNNKELNYKKQKVDD